MCNPPSQPAPKDHAMALEQEDVKAAIASGKNHKLKDGRSLYLYVKNGHGFWVHQFTDFGPTKNNPTPHPHTRSTCLGPAWDMTPAQARKARDKFAVDGREGRDVGLASKRATGERSDGRSSLPRQPRRRMERPPQSRAKGFGAEIYSSGL